MKERPILFNAEMVRAILDGRKVQTRRVMKVQPPADGYELLRIMETTGPKKQEGKLQWAKLSENRLSVLDRDPTYFDCPFGVIADRLWVRESFWHAGRWVQSHPEDDEYSIWDGSRRVHYSSEGTPPNEPNRHYPNGLLNGSYSARDPELIWRSRPSIHMPRWASRIQLEITGVRVERLQDISERDAESEGCYTNEQYGDLAGDENLWPCPICEGWQVHGALGANMGWTEVDCISCDTAKKRFENLWASVAGPGSWDLNPWVWVIEFKRINQ